MNLRTEVLKEHSRKQTVKIARYVNNDQKRFDKLMKLFLSSEYLIAQRASWVVSYCVESYPQLIKPHLDKMIKNLDRKNIHDAVKRNSVRILQFIEIPEKILGIAANKCFEYLSSTDEPIAVKVFSMTVLSNICKQEPELKKELKLSIEGQMDYASAGFKARAKKVLKDLQRTT